MIRRGCLGCLIPLLALALLAYAIHLWTTPPGYSHVNPAPPGTLQLAEAQAVAAALSGGQSVAVVHLTDAEATSLLQNSLGGYDGLSNLEVHALKGRVVVSGQTSILNHPLVISGPVVFGGEGGSRIKLRFTGLSIGQMTLPSLIPQALARGFHPAFALALIAGDDDLSFSCEAARPNDLIVGVTFGQGKPAAGVDACSARS
ncbi:MAG: hypothetical protein WB867_07890 [Candidatus Dormiibacterota bacterium]